ncbi:hypothetical protein VN12_10555 [Pirellula sp. SH-Sr6A]|nr:hypothetical protein VN12_10555 [Pirellula sp. SH-Sr6A]
MSESGATSSAEASKPNSKNKKPFYEMMRGSVKLAIRSFLHQS